MLTGTQAADGFSGPIGNSGSVFLQFISITLSIPITFISTVNKKRAMPLTQSPHVSEFFLEKYHCECIRTGTLWCSLLRFWKSKNPLIEECLSKLELNSYYEYNCNQESCCLTNGILHACVQKRKCMKTRGMLTDLWEMGKSQRIKQRVSVASAPCRGLLLCQVTWTVSWLREDHSRNDQTHSACSEPTLLAKQPYEKM